MLEAGARHAGPHRAAPRRTERPGGPGVGGEGARLAAFGFRLSAFGRPPQLFSFFQGPFCPKIPWRTAVLKKNDAWKEGGISSRVCGQPKSACLTGAGFLLEFQEVKALTGHLSGRAWVVLCHAETALTIAMNPAAFV